MTQLLYFISSWAETGAKKWTCQTGSCPRTEHWQKSNSGISPPRSCQYHHQPSAAARAGFARGFTGIPPLPTSEPVQYPALASWTSIYLDCAKFMYFYRHFPPSLLSDVKSLISFRFNKFIHYTWFFSAKVHRDTFKINLMYVPRKCYIYSTVVV